MNRLPTWDDIEWLARVSPILQRVVWLVHDGQCTREQALIMAAVAFVEIDAAKTERLIVAESLRPVVIHVDGPGDGSE
jgi:hypothetical protein